ncbi:MAG: GNAT family N-acetyltransferase [Pseudomonadota bacterium]
MTGVVLETERLVLRPPVAEDLAPWVAFLSSDRGRWHGGGSEGGAGRAWRIVAILMGHWQLTGFGVFVCVERATGRALGAVGPFFPVDWPERELGWSIWAPADEGHGYAAEAGRAVIAHAARDLAWDTLVSYVDPANTRSCALAERLGARRDPKAARPEPGDLVYRHDLKAAA